jgi:hypothetical protein
MWDKYQHKLSDDIINDPHKIFINFPYQDFTGITGHFGKKTHTVVSKIILEKIKQNES